MRVNRVWRRGEEPWLPLACYKLNLVFQRLAQRHGSDSLQWLYYSTKLLRISPLPAVGSVLCSKKAWLFLCRLALTFNLTNAALIIGCILQHFALTIFPTLPSSLWRLLSIYNSFSQCAAVKLSFFAHLQQHSADPLMEGVVWGKAGGRTTAELRLKATRLRQTVQTSRGENTEKPSFGRKRETSCSKLLHPSGVPCALKHVLTIF